MLETALAELTHKREGPLRMVGGCYSLVGKRRSWTDEFLVPLGSRVLFIASAKRPLEQGGDKVAREFGSIRSVKISRFCLVVWMIISTSALGPE